MNKTLEIFDGHMSKSKNEENDATYATEGVIQKTMEYRLPSWLVYPKQFKDGCEYKFVRFADGKVLFSWIGDMISHKDIVECGYTHPIKEGDKLSGLKPPAVSAGKIKVRKGGWTITEGGSWSAHLPRCESDEKFIQAELGSKWIEDVEAGY